MVCLGPLKFQVDAKASPGLFWGASLKKVPKGAWVPLVIGVVM